MSYERVGMVRHDVRAEQLGGGQQVGFGNAGGARQGTEAVQRLVGPRERRAVCLP
jgi:hypothetical protein